MEDQIKKECRVRGLPEPKTFERLESIQVFSLARPAPAANMKSEAGNGSQFIVIVTAVVRCGRLLWRGGVRADKGVAAHLLIRRARLVAHGV